MFRKLTKCQKILFYCGMVWMLRETRVTCDKQSQQRDTAAVLAERSLCTGCQERLVHELLFGEAQPPLGGLAIWGVEDTFTHPQASLLPQLLEVLLHQLWDGDKIG